MKITSKTNFADIFKDKRGKIISLLNKDFGHCLLIESSKGSIRANHYHKKDWHYCYILEGKIHYYTRKVGVKDRPKKEIFKKGDLFYTPSLLEHAFYFPVKTQFITLGKLSRKKSIYEKDTVRVQLI